jgi:hypothetical protein
MIYFIRSGAIAPGKMTKALGFAHEIAEYIKTKTSKDVSIGMPIGGQANRIGWFVAYENLAELDETQMSLLKDSVYLEKVAQAGDNFIAGSMHDDIWRIL